MNEDQQKRGGIDLRDVAGLLGAALITAGAGMLAIPAGLIVGGMLVLAFAILAARRP